MKEIGIKAVLTTGRLIEFNSFYEKVKADDPEIDVFFAAWGTGSDLNAMKLKGPRAPFNYPRFVSDENTKLMEDTANPKTLTDPNYKAEAYKRWLAYYIDQAVEVPLTYRYEVFPINKRVKNYNISYASQSQWAVHLIELTAAEPIKSTK